MNFNWSIDARGSGRNTFYNDYIGNTTNDIQGGISLYWNDGGNTITCCTISGAPWAIGIELSNGNTVTQNNLFGGILLQFAGNETIDRNYWSDYSTKYPNATEIDSSGIGNTPYAIDKYTNGVVTGVIQDNHPLVEPMTIPSFPTPSSRLFASPSPSPSASPIPSFTSSPTFEPTSTSRQQISFLGTGLPTEYVYTSVTGAVALAIAVAAISLLFRVKKIRK